MPGDLTDPQFYQRWLTSAESLSAEVQAFVEEPEGLGVALVDAFGAIEACGARVELVRASKGFARVLGDLAEKASGQRQRLWGAVILHAPEFDGIALRGKIQGRWVREVSIVRPVPPVVVPWTAPTQNRATDTRNPPEPGPVNAARFKFIELPDD